MPSKHNFISHTADIAFEVEADSLEELFVESFYGWFNSVIFSDNELKIHSEMFIEIKADSLEQLLVDFLNELNFLLITKKILCLRIENLTIDKRNILLNAFIRTHNLEDTSIIKSEIKAVTYHQMEIIKKDNKYFVKVVFDI
ncbi:MAG: archease [Ignavibacterium sp.]|nr:archease [Ignavibacterium sp.]MCX7611564.1 archease [Ignavibacterium sp.]MDW8376292.1 archease [Ignavibacteriales bacterium]